MYLINRETNLILICSADCVISSAVGSTKVAITDTKFYVPFVTLPTQVNQEIRF